MRLPDTVYLSQRQTNRSLTALSITSADIARLKSLVDVGAAVSYNHPTVARLRGGNKNKTIVSFIAI